MPEYDLYTYTTLFRSLSGTDLDIAVSTEISADVETAGAITIPAKKLSEIARELPPAPVKVATSGEQRVTIDCGRSEEHTSELQSRRDLVCRLLLEKKK